MPPDDEGAMLGHELSLRMVLFHAALAGRLGVGTTEHKVLDMLGSELGPTLTELSRGAGLSNAAITKIIDRLEAAGYVRRVPDPMDGRSARVVLTDHYRSVVGTPYAGLAARIEAVNATLSASGREAVRTWLLGVLDALRAETSQLSGMSSPPPE